MYYSDIKEIDVINGEGLRLSLFVSGCTIHCKGCFNVKTWDFKYGKPFIKEIEDNIINKIKNSNYNYQGISILGGEPMDNCKELYNFLSRFKKEITDKDIWLWSGYTLEEINKDNNKKDLLKLCDTVILGPFIESEKNLKLKFRGSNNQHIYKKNEKGIFILVD